MDWRNLTHLKGHPARLAPAGTAGPVLHGLLNNVTDRGLEMELLDVPSSRLSGRYRVEVIDSEAMVQFVTAGETNWLQPSRINLDCPEHVEFIQRRQHPRAYAMLPVWMKAIADEVDPLTLDGEPVPDDHPHGHTQNISVGGVALITNEFYATGQRVLLSLELSPGSYIAGVVATVIRQLPGPGGTWLTALSFLRPSPEIVNVISQLVTTLLQVAPTDHGYGKIIRKAPQN